MTNLIPTAILLTNTWLTTATITPHHTGESNFNSTTVHIERAEWFQREIYKVFIGDQEVEIVKTNKVVISLANTPISTREPFWYEGRMYRFVPTNMPAALTVIPFRFRDEIARPPQPPLPPNFR